MKKLIASGVFLLATFLIYGQNISDTIQVKRAMGIVFMQQGQILTPRQLLEVTSSNAEAYSVMKMAKRNYNASSALGFAGGFLIGWPLGAAVAGGEPNWTMAAVGACLVVISIPFSTSYSKYAKQAVILYNDELKRSGAGSPEASLGFTSDGIGLRIRF